MKKANKLAKEAIIELNKKGIDLNVDEIVALNDLAEKSKHPVSSILSFYMGIKVGDIYLYPLTIGAKLWLKESAGVWFLEDNQSLSLSVLYAYNNSKNLDAFKFDDAKQCKKAITKWAKKLNVTQEEIAKAISQFEIDTIEDSAEEILSDLIDQIKKHPEQLDLKNAIKYLEAEDEDESNGSIAAALSALMHFFPSKTEEEWIWETAGDYCNELIGNIGRLQGSEEENVANDPSIIAFKQFKDLIFSIEKRRNE